MAYFQSFNIFWWYPHMCDLTVQLQAATAILGPTFGILPTDISACLLHSIGAMALLCTNLDTNRICLLEHWQSDEMLHYLNVQAYPVVSHLSGLMLQHGNFNFIPDYAFA